MVLVRYISEDLLMQSPALPAFFNMQATDKEGKLSPDFYLYNDQMFQVLNSRLTIWGVVFPPLTNADVAALPANVTIGTTWYNSNLNKLQFLGIIAGVPTVQTITSV